MSKKAAKILSVHNLKTQFRTDNGLVEAVRGIDFELHRKETLGIVGESGSGKSVTALSLLQLLPQPGEVTQGEALFWSDPAAPPTDLLQLDSTAIRGFRGKRLSMIFQEPMSSLNPLIRCGEQIAESIQLHSGLKGDGLNQKVLDWLDRVQLNDPKRIYQAYPHQLSGGQKQRVMIAMALCTHPDILIADEPTTALDVTVQQAILALISDLQKELGTAVIFITHDLGVIGQIADRSLVMHRGEILERGPIQQLFNRPQHPYTQGLLACRPPLEYRLARLPQVSDFWTGDEPDPSNGPGLKKISKKETAQRLLELKEQEPILKVENLKVRFPASSNFWGKTNSYIQAVDEVSFVVYPGETLGLVGESGCGKTSLGRSLLRLLEPTSGEIYYKRENVLNFDEKEVRKLRKEMQIIFQDPYASLNPRMMVGSAIMEPMQLYEAGNKPQLLKEKTMNLLEQVGLLPEHFYRYPHEFSGGQRQRICIARALAVDPKFIVCDEAVSALDVSIQAQVLNLLKNLREERGLTYIFISHDLSVVKFMSDRIMVMKKGKIVESGPADAIYFTPQNPYTKELIAAIPK